MAYRSLEPTDIVFVPVLLGGTLYSLVFGKANPIYGTHRLGLERSMDLYMEIPPAFLSEAMDLTFKEFMDLMAEMGEDKHT